MAEKKTPAAPRARKPAAAKAPKAPRAPKAKAVEAAPVEAAPLLAAPAVDTVTGIPDPASVRDLAYRLWQERGGSSFDNWLEAERRLSQPGA